MGRRNKYEEFVKPYLQDIVEWSKELNERQIAAKLGIAVSTLEKYKLEHEELGEVLKEGKQKCKAAKIEKFKSLLEKRAEGFFTSVHSFV